MLALRRRSWHRSLEFFRNIAGHPFGSLKSGGSERGMATAEFAVVLPAVVLVLALSLGALGLAWDQIRCVDAARAGARAASRGDSSEAVTLVTSRAAPSGAEVSIGAAGDLIQVSVVSRPRVAASLLPSWLRASSTASAVREPSGPQ
ncbi:MAG: TadE family type IV pilus minor pilin [Actinomycetota bacterium]